MSEYFKELKKAIDGMRSGRYVVDMTPLANLARVAAEEVAAKDAMIDAAREANAQLRNLLLWIDGWEPNFTDDENWPSDERRAKNAHTELAAALQDYDKQKEGEK